MRIMHISTRLILGGSQENTVLSCEGQADRGHDVALVYGPIYGPEGSMLERVRAHGDIEAIESPNLIREIHPWRDARAGFELRRIIRRWRPDVVHTHSSKAGILGRWAAWRERVPAVVHTVHGPPFHRFERRWRNMLYILTERFAARRCHRIVCVAQAMRDQFLAKRIGRAEQYDIVFSGMETDPFINNAHDRGEVRRSIGLSDEAYVVGTVARLAEHKGHDDLLDALGPVMQQRPEMHLLWVGDGWWRQRLMQRVRDMGLEGRVITTGLVPPDAIPKYLQAMDLLAHSSYREGLPRTVTQALLSAVPVVATDVDGTREICIDGETGRLVPPGDAAALRDAICWMMDHPADARTLAEAGRSQAARQFDAAVMIDALEDVYAAVLNGADIDCRTGRVGGGTA